MFILQREASKSFITANLQSFNKILHGASALYQPAMDQDSGEIIFPDTEEYGDFLSEDAWYEWQLHFMDDPDTQNFPLENKDFTVRESRHTAADDDDRQEGKKDMELSEIGMSLTLLHSERPKLYTILAFLSAIGLSIYPKYCGCLV